MAKTACIALYLCFLFHCGFPHCYGPAEIREKTAAIFDSQVGVRQTGHNSGPEIKKYLAATGLPEGHPWCAAFVKYVLKSAGAETGNANAWSPSWFPNSKTIYKRNDNTKNATPQKGDVFGLYYPSLKRIAHVGFVEKWGNTVTTVEGNTNDNGSRTGDGVYRKFRLKSQIYAVSDWIGTR